MKCKDCAIRPQIVGTALSLDFFCTLGVEEVAAGSWPENDACKDFQPAVPGPTSPDVAKNLKNAQTKQEANE